MQQELNPGPSTQQSNALLLSYRRLTEATRTCSWPYTCNAYYSTCRFMYSVGTKRKGEDSNVTNIPFTATCTCTCRISFTSRKFKMHGHTCSTVHVLCSYFFATILLLKQPKNMIMFPKVWPLLINSHYFMCVQTIQSEAKYTNVATCISSAFDWIVCVHGRMWIN